MTALENPSQLVTRHLLEAIDELRRDIDKVEIWASALDGFSQPIPDYQPSEKFLMGAQEHSDKRAAAGRDSP